MRRRQWFYLLLIAALLFVSCQPAELAASEAGTFPSAQSKVDPVAISVSLQHLDLVPGLEENECLVCHSDKERLIETAEEEQVVESESSGVG